MILRALTAAASLTVLTACGVQTASEPETPTLDAWLTGVDLPSFLDCAREQDVTLLQAHRAGDRAGCSRKQYRCQPRLLCRRGRVYRD
jgi:hypothetical protein